MERNAHQYGIRIVAHRGASRDAPENTLAAFALAWQQGADGIEADFRLTLDGHVVCIHDADTARIAGVRRVVAETTLAELRTLDVGSWKGAQFADQRIATLPEVLAGVPAEKLAFLELKTGPEIVAPVRRAIESSPLAAEQVVVIAFDAATIAEAKRAMPHIRAHWLVRYEKNQPGRPPRPSTDEILATLRTTRADGIGSQARVDVVNAHWVKTLCAGGLREFHLWTVNDDAAARHFRPLAPFSIATDFPADLRTWLGK